MAELTHERIDIGPLCEAAARPDCGAIAMFLGTTRDHHEGRHVVRLEYEAFAAMAVREMTRLENEARVRFEVASCLVVHRLGTVPPAEASVAIVVVAAHRGPAFEACRWLIDELKRVVPIWKKEHYAGGEADWVRGRRLDEPR